MFIFALISIDTWFRTTGISNQSLARVEQDDSQGSLES